MSHKADPIREKVSVMVSEITQVYPATARWKRYVTFIRSPWEGKRVEEVETTSTDPYEILAIAPEGVIAFIFERRMVVEIEIDGNTYLVEDEFEIDGAPKFYFINAKKMFSRKEVTHWWKWGGDEMKIAAMNRRGSDHVVSWQAGVDLGYDPRVDVLLTR